ncbi:hypothetical protein RHSIM_Rhsim09G0047700 [Rhododendron simsii]|uniref:Uncharacterized protein n=1 Tax=Rhododendron simsii TaxID=118357 RepID=A0A834LB43_RHOSS|nr:hypothetical protein RHSIM_Rhsim09G0047700 [Rhododendron simsii]
MPVFKAAQNVNVIGKPDFAYQKGSSPLSSVLHGASILLRVDPNWDWFINLSAADYPLVSQDDLLHILSYLPRDLNFVNHTSYIGWRESRKLKPIIVDPGLYLKEKNAMFYATQKRELPDAFQLFMDLDQAHKVNQSNAPLAKQDPWPCPFQSHQRYQNGSAVAVASKACNGSIATKAAMSAVTEQPVPVIFCIMATPFCAPTTRCPSVTKSTAPDIATIQPLDLAKDFAASTASVD